MDELFTNLLYEFSCIHRAEYHETLYEEAQRLGCEIRLDCEAVSVSNEDEFCSVTTKDGEVIQGDVIVGADGVYESSSWWHAN